ncbi:hypothetical protein ACH347_04865 [Saccharopolyspora sp. 5N102]
MPIVVGTYGIATALASCVVLLLVASLAGYFWGPETSDRELADR